MNLAESTCADAAGVETSLAALPVGSTEQHGPHAPLGTDTLAAEAVTREAVDRLDREVVVAPPIPVGVAEEHRQFAGTLWVEPDTFRSYVRETVASLAHHGHDRVVVVNGHGGNVAPLWEACARLTRDGTALAVPFTWFDAVDTADLGVSMGHAGPVETSLLRYLRSDLVDESQVERAADGASDRWGEWVAGVDIAYDAAEFTDSGVVGDPREGSADIGEQLHDRASERLATLFEALASRETAGR